MFTVNLNLDMMREADFVMEMPRLYQIWQLIKEKCSCNVGQRSRWSSVTVKFQTISYQRRSSPSHCLFIISAAFLLRGLFLLRFLSYVSVVSELNALRLSGKFVKQLLVLYARHLWFNLDTIFNSHGSDFYFWITFILLFSPSRS